MAVYLSINFQNWGCFQRVTFDELRISSFTKEDCHILLVSCHLANCIYFVVIRQLNCDNMEYGSGDNEGYVMHKLRTIERECSQFKKTVHSQNLCYCLDLIGRRGFCRLIVFGSIKPFLLSATIEKKHIFSIFFAWLDVGQFELNVEFRYRMGKIQRRKLFNYSETPNSGQDNSGPF